MPIVMSKDEWARIAKWTDTDREDPEMARRREYVKYLDATSKEMTKHWPNSVENVNKRNEELRRERIAEAEKANTRFYKRYVKRQKEQQQRLMHSARDMVFQNKDAPKLLLSAVIETVIQKERMEQLKFLDEQRRLQAENKRRDDDDIIQKANEWNQLMADRKKKRYQVNKEHQKEILDQANEIAERNRIEYEMELNLQKIDNIKANEQMDAIKEFEDNFKAAEKARIWSDMDRSKQENEQRRKEQEARDRMDHKLMEVLLRSNTRIDRRRKQTEIDLKNEKLRVLEKISQKLESGDAAREEKEQAILKKAIEEKEAINEARRQADIRKMEEFKKQRVSDREQFLRDERRRVNEFNTMRQWEIMNRFKNSEIHDEFKEKLRLEKERKVKEYREDILRLWKERDDREAQERAETRHFYGEEAEKKLRDGDNKLLTHANKLLEEAARHGRPDFALHKAIDRYCKLYRLYPMPPLPSSLQEHNTHYAPWDGSSPDPWYQEPPPPGLGSHHESSPKKDGMQEKPTTSKPVKKSKDNNPDENVVDYKRTGPANGMQRRNAQADVTLPPIVAIPYNTGQCRCELKHK